MLRSEPGVAWLPDHVVRQMVAEAERVSPLETGGVLVGYWVLVGQELVITEATGPGAAALHSLKRFEPDVYHDRQEIARLYAESGRFHNYAGDWHSHPAGSSELSRLDRQTLRQIARSSEAHAPMPIMAILAGGREGANSWRLAVWRLVNWKEWFATGVTTATLLKIRTYSE
jgi:integrative and conjugative element protein (TIGR02256 family)